MNKTTLASFLVGLIFILGCTQQAETTQGTLQENIITPTTIPVEQKPSSIVPAEEKTIAKDTGTVDVTIEGFAFNPATITIKKGTTVRWTQRDSVKHTVTSDDGIFDSNLLSLGQTWSYTFDKSGTFSYHCRPHPNMKGKVIVE